MDNEGIARQATYLVRGIHPAEEVVLVSTETSDGLISFSFHKRFSLDGIVLVQAFRVTFTASGRFINITTNSQAEIKEVPAGILTSLTALIAGTKKAAIALEGAEPQGGEGNER